MHFYFLIIISVFSLRSILAQDIARCSNGSVICDDQKQCIGSFQWCDKKEDCEDKSDEYYCEKAGWLTNGDPNDCEYSSLHFKCDNGICIPKSAQCDGHDDCIDGSDEYTYNCPTETSTNISKEDIAEENNFEEAGENTFFPALPTVTEEPTTSSAHDSYSPSTSTTQSYYRSTTPRKYIIPAIVFPSSFQPQQSTTQKSRTRKLSTEKDTDEESFPISKNGRKRTNHPVILRNEVIEDKLRMKLLKLQQQQMKEKLQAEMEHAKQIFQIEIQQIKEKFEIEMEHAKQKFQIEMQQIKEKFETEMIQTEEIHKMKTDLLYEEAQNLSLTNLNFD